MSNGDIIRMEGVSKTYGSGEIEVEALRGLDLCVDRREMLAIMGPSGSGKSTLMNVMGCLDVPTSGRYEFAGRDVASLKPNQLADLRNRSIGFVFQAFHLLPHATALENVEMPLLFGGVPTRKRRDQAMEMLSRVGLGDRASHLPTQLSGGEMQRVAIARALANQPQVILADEPTGNLDTRTGRGIIELFQTLWRDGVTIILITHDLQIARACSRVLMLRDGRIVYDGREVPGEEEVLSLDARPAPVT